MAFRDIKGQEGAVEFFRRAVNGNRLAHAYLFLGPEGLGKTLLAKNLAKFVNCENPVIEDNRGVDCCDSCNSCHKIEGGNHPDIHWVEPAGRANKISIDDIRSVQKEISLKAYEGKWKVFIILEAQKMTEQAANCLLKTLEEPPRSSLIVLSAEGLSGLLPTIVSRCHLIKFYPLNYETLKEILISDYKLDPETVHFLSAQTEGRIGRALELKDQDALLKKNRLIERIRQPGGGRGASYDIFNIKDKKELSAQIAYLLNWFRDILVFKAGLSASSVINADRLEGIKSESRYWDFEDLEKILTQIDEADTLIKQNVNPKIALEVMLQGLEKCNTK